MPDDEAVGGAVDFVRRGLRPGDREDWREA